MDTRNRSTGKSAYSVVLFFGCLAFTVLNTSSFSEAQTGTGTGGKKPPTASSSNTTKKNKKSKSANRPLNKADKTSHPLGSQTMTNSPGGIQAGGDVIVNQAPPTRKLNEPQQMLFSELLKSNPKGEITVSCIENGSAEPCTFARQIVNLLKANGWTVVSFEPMIAWGDPNKIIPEIYIQVQSNEHPPDRAKVLQHALKIAGYEAIGFAESSLGPDAVHLTVSTKRP